MSITTSKDFYRILGVSEDAGKDEIRKAYRKLAKRHHPDANAGNPEAAERFKEIGEAYSVLSNDEKRQQYDQMRKYGGFDPRASRAQGRPGQAGSEAFSFDDLGGLGDIFSSIFDRGRRRTEGFERRGPRRGQDVKFAVEISLKTAVKGGKISIEVPITEECTTCSGSGARPGSGLRSCVECGGSGTVSFGQGGFAVNRPCPACMGRGAVPEALCTSCGGGGQLQQKRKLQVTVPAGVDTGSKLRLTGQGARGESGGSPGDLILTFQVKPHSFFRRKGLDIHVTIPINVAQAILGSKVKVRTVHGSHAVLTIPPGTQSGTRFRIAGQGVTKDGRTGNQYVEVKVETPESMPEEGREKIREFAEVTGMRY